ncbi:MAG TPA: MFS transporter [Chondromyces sp.]|nr:MFS transporter [Chondromyces sp.]
MEKTLKKEKLWTKSFILLIVGNLFVFMAFQMLIPTLPPYFQSIGASGLEVGLVTALFSLGAVLVRPFVGYLLEFKARKMMVIVSTVVLLIITLFYPLTSIVFVLLALRFVHGLAWGWSTTVNGTAAVDVVPNSRIGEGMGYYGLAITVGMIIAPSLGIFLYQRTPFSVLITVSAVFGVLALVLLAFISDRTPKNVLLTKREDVAFSFKGSLIEKTSWYPAFVTFVATFGYGTIVTFIIIFSEERKLDQIFLFYLFNAIVATLVRPITGKYFDQHGPKVLVAVCSIFTFVAMWILSFAYSNPLIIIAGILFGAGYGSLIPTLQAWVLSMTPPQRRGVANGMFYSAIDLGIGLSGLVFGVIASFTEVHHLFQISSFFFLVVIVLTMFDHLFFKGKPITIAKHMK